MVFKLKVAEAFRTDVGRGIVRISGDVMESLGIASGGVVEVLGKRRTTAVAWRGHPQDDGLDVVRMDGFVRHNCGVSMGDSILIKRANPQEAESVEFAPVEKVKISGNFTQYLKHRLQGRALVEGDRIVVGVLGSTIPFVVTKTVPSGIVSITERTKVGSSAFGSGSKEERPMPKITYEDIGSLDSEIKKIREMVELPMKHPEIFKKLGIEPPKGVLLYGPPGTGKTLLAKAVASEIDVNFVVLNGPEIVSKWYGQSEQNLRKVFKDAEESAPSVIFIDEIDAIAPKRSEVQGEVEKRIVAQLLTLLDGLESRGNVMVIGATNRESVLDPALRRPGRFDREISLGVPDKAGRREILEIHTRSMPLAKNVKIDAIAATTHGFVGADLSALCKEAAFGVLRRLLPEMDLEKGEIPDDVLEKLIVTKNDFDEALKNIEPSAMREVLVETPSCSWKDIGGLKHVKNNLTRVVEKPIREPETFKKYGIKPARGVLLYGPPGCGKTLLARAVAGESEANFISVKGPEVLSMWLGESEKAIRNIFKKARQVAPCVIFFDEIDALAGKRGFDNSRAGDRVLNQLLTEMDGIEELENVIVLAATNRPDLVDGALMRPGRFDQLVLVGSPDKEARLNIFKVHTREMPVQKVNFSELTELTEGYSGADIEAVCREAAYAAMDEKSEKVTNKHFLSALGKVRPSINESEIRAYIDYSRKSGEGPLNEASYA